MSRKVEQPNATFAVITDTHCAVRSTAVGETLWNRQLLTRSEEIAELLIESLNSHDLDFIIHCGDLTHNGDRESLEFVRGVFERLRAPTHFTLGNREPSSQDARRTIQSVFSLASATFFRAEYLCGLRFIFLDTNYMHLPTGEVSEFVDRTVELHFRGLGLTREQLVWLEQELRRDTETLTCVVLHHPVASKAEYPIITPRDLGPASHRIKAVWRDLFPVYYEEARAILEQFENVRVVFSGHWHITEIVRVNRIYHVKTPALVEFPFEYRVVRAYPQYFDISTHGLPSEELRNASRVPEWQNDWIQGESFDRCRRIYFDDTILVAGSYEV